MTRFWKLLPAALVCTGLVANAQPPAGRAPADVPRGERREAPKADAQVEAWVKTLADKITDPHDTIRDSARAALVAVGQPAVPLLQKLADGDDAAKSTAAKKLIGSIDRGNRPTGLASRGGLPGGGPMGAFPGAPMGGFPGFGGRGGPMALGGDRPQGNPREERGPAEGRPMDRRPDADRRPEGRPAEGDRRPEGRPAEADRRPEGRPMERRPDADRRPEGDRRPEAGARPEGERRPANPLEESIKSLNLNEKQQKQVKEILDANQKKMAEEMEKAREGKGDRNTVREAREGMMKELKDLLSAEQFEKFAEAMRKNAPPGAGRPEGGDRRRPDRD